MTGDESEAYIYLELSASKFHFLVHVPCVFYFFSIRVNLELTRRSECFKIKRCFIHFGLPNMKPCWQETVVFKLKRVFCRMRFRPQAQCSDICWLSKECFEANQSRFSKKEDVTWHDQNSLNRWISVSDRRNCRWLQNCGCLFNVIWASEDES